MSSLPQPGDRSLEDFRLRPGDLFGLTWSGASITVEVEEIRVEGNGYEEQCWAYPDDGTVYIKLRKLTREQVNAMLDEYISEYQEEIRARRAADPGYQTPVEHDWREQIVAEVGELPGEDSGDRGEVRRDPA